MNHIEAVALNLKTVGTINQSKRVSARFGKILYVPKFTDTMEEVSGLISVPAYEAHVYAFVQAIHHVGIADFDHGSPVE